MNIKFYWKCFIQSWYMLWEDKEWQKLLLSVSASTQNRTTRRMKWVCLCGWGPYEEGEGLSGVVHICVWEWVGPLVQEEWLVLQRWRGGREVVTHQLTAHADMYSTHIYIYTQHSWKWHTATAAVLCVCVRACVCACWHIPWAHASAHIYLCIQTLL